MLYGVDVHAQYQAGLDLGKLKAEGYTFFVTKSSEGLHIPPIAGSSAEFRRRYLSWVELARSVGMVPGLYHWIDSSAPGADQARFFYKLVLEAGGPGGMLIQLDCEDDASYQQLLDFTTTWAQLSAGHPFLLYTGKWWWGPRGWNGTAVTPYLWDSHYLTADADTISDDPAVFAARIPASWWAPGYGGWGSPAILQFTSRGDAGSLGNNVDLNVFRGGLADLAVLTGGEDMLTPEDLTTLQVAPWQYRNADGVADWAKNKPNDWYPDMHAVVWDTYRKVEALAAKLAALEVGGVDLDALAEKVAAAVGKREAAADRARADELD